MSAASGSSVADRLVWKMRRATPCRRLACFLVLAFAGSLVLSRRDVARSFGAPATKSRKAGRGFGAVTKPKKASGSAVVDRRLGKQPASAKRKELLAETANQPIMVGDLEVNLLVPAYVQDYGRFAEMVGIGAGTVSDVVWPSEQALAGTLMQHQQLWSSDVIDVGDGASGSQRICELGAGLGLAGIAIAMNGAEDVLLTDRDDLILKIAQQSAQENGVGDRVSTAAFDWGNREDWPEAGSCGLVVAADVLYDQEVVEPLTALIRHLSGGRAVVIEPVNEDRLRLNARENFEAAARSNGLAVNWEDYVAPGGSSPLRILWVGGARD
eukprot:TRINITY_DN9465_c0_g1_i1.p1 TRINITY_DN9465_c0_g1~~TRINITY_DN9465_c0_g1_i1.p1  ORF type:complete len:326 (+),score=63.27 TRINITY_DN9465_c0_g1_i1:73-1050(+)